MEDVDGWIKGCKGMKFALMVTEMHSKLDYLEFKKSRKDNVSGPVSTNVKKVLEFLLKQSIEVHDKNTARRTKLEARDEHNEILRELAEKITWPSVGSTDEIVVKEAPVKHVKKGLYSNCHVNERAN